MKSPPAPARKGRVLVVDDDEAIRLRVRDLLEGSGLCEVSEASNGPEGLAAVRADPPDLILLDIMMPGMTGLTVCELLRADKSTREIPIIVLSAADEDRAMPSALAVGAEDYLAKPIPSAELKAKVRTIMELNRYHSLTQERRRLRWLVEHSDEGLVLLDPKGRLLEANRRARELFGLPDQPGIDALPLLAAHYQPEPPDAYERLRHQGFRAGEGFAVVRPETCLASAHWLKVQLFADDSTEDGDLLLKFTDRTDQVQHDLQSWSFQRMLSHKIRTPLNGLESMLALLAESPALQADAETAELLGHALESGRRLESTLTSILAYHQAVCGSRVPPAQSGPATWTALVGETVAEAGLDVSLLRLDDPAGAGGAPLPGTLLAALRQALLEVMDNYRKFSSATSAGVDVTVLSPTSLRLFSPGPALPPDILARLGRPYWQLEQRFSGEVPGMGLGLATARVLLRSLGADLRFANHPEQDGLVVELHLPAA